MSICSAPSKEVTKLVSALGLPSNCVEFSMHFKVDEPVRITATFLGDREGVEALSEFSSGYTVDSYNHYVEEFVLREKNDN